MTVVLTDVLIENNEYIRFLLTITEVRDYNSKRYGSSKLYSNNGQYNSIVTV
jgi:hypothetical protein